MGSAKPTLVYDAAFENVGEQRRADRRASDRRAPKQHFDPLFAATLINQVIAPERAPVRVYAATQGHRPGIAFNVRA
jgi:hypothetical protein